MNEGRLKEIEARCEAATPGPWVSLGEPVHSSCVATSIEGPDGAVVIAPARCDNNPATGEPMGDFLDMNEADEIFIVHSRQDVVDLLREVRRLREQKGAD